MGQGSWARSWSDLRCSKADFSAFGMFVIVVPGCSCCPIAGSLILPKSMNPGGLANFCNLKVLNVRECFFWLSHWHAEDVYVCFILLRSARSPSQKVVLVKANALWKVLNISQPSWRSCSEDFRSNSDYFHHTCWVVPTFALAKPFCWLDLSAFLVDRCAANKLWK